MSDKNNNPSKISLHTSSYPLACCRIHTSTSRQLNVVRPVARVSVSFTPYSLSYLRIVGLAEKLPHLPTDADTQLSARSDPPS